MKYFLPDVSDSHCLFAVTAEYPMPLNPAHVKISESRDKNVPHGVRACVMAEGKLRNSSPAPVTLHLPKALAEDLIGPGPTKRYIISTSTPDSTISH